MNAGQDDGQAEHAMTALEQYERLEAEGLWRPAADAQRREVLVSFGSASLVIADRNDVALAHWSLPALTRLNPGKRPALYAPGGEAAETLEIADATMVDAVETVRRALAREGPQRGRIRLVAGLGVALLIGLLGWFWLPGALVNHTVGVVPDEQRVRISRALMAEVTALTGPACTSPRGLSVLGVLSRDLLGARRIAVVLPDGVPGAVMLPDGTVLLDRALVEDHDGPEILAAYLVREAVRRTADDPLARMLRDAGTGPTLRLFTSGQLPDRTLRGWAAKLLRAPQDPVPAEDFLARLAEAGVPSTPYARAIDPAGTATAALIAADPMAGQRAPSLMSDADWVALQQICAD
ncbi:MAG TPA: hypothetical protein DDY29_04800 [Rhodobacteraceae bacterium]|nr:hypothetical protein [Paracoccaceae bacterium]